MIKFNNKKNFKFTWNVMLKTSLLSTLLFTLIIATSSLSYASTSKELPISAYGNLPAFSQLKLSPNGKNLAFIKNHDGLLVLTILNIKNGEQNYIIKADNIEVTLNWHTWASDDIILFSAGYSSSNRNVKYTKTRLYKFDISHDTKISLAVEPRKSKKEIYAQFQDN
jgi:hypothetical protein